MSSGVEDLKIESMGSYAADALPGPVVGVAESDAAVIAAVAAVVKSKKGVLADFVTISAEGSPEESPALEVSSTRRSLELAAVFAVLFSVGELSYDSFIRNDHEGRDVVQAVPPVANYAREVIDRRRLKVAGQVLDRSWSPRVFEKLRGATTVLKWRKNEDVASQSSGVFIRRNVIVTAKHGVKPVLTSVEAFDSEGMLQRVWENGTVQPVVISHPTLDFAILIFPSPLIDECDCVRPSGGIFRPNSVVAACTNDLENVGEIKPGFLKNFVAEGGVIDVVMEIVPGNSGSPVVDINGDIIGIIVDTVLVSGGLHDPPMGKVVHLTKEMIDKMLVEASKEYPQFFPRISSEEERQGRRGIESGSGRSGKEFSGRKPRVSVSRPVKGDFSVKGRGMRPGMGGRGDR